MATFRQREGRWQAIIRRVDLKATKTFDTLQDAKKWATAQERAADLGGIVPGKMDGSLGPLIEKYEREIWTDRKWGPSTAYQLKMLRQDLGNRLLRGLSSATLVTS